ncbi:MAG: branched-chain amino acid ABC transporter ATP-binding protein [Candidatus Rokubacteria bacterium GWA2_70_23]|nr:MAG: branched-chain amino acid ABC transporter ATP-binding protein [Candidatus Rokubacteria bacterium GWA2_70_23]
MLEADGLHVGYGDAPALWDISLTVGDGELVAVVGPNGAGKTTLINAIARLLPIRRGRLRLDGVDVTRATPQEVCQRGVAIIPEGRRLFGGMTVEENLEIGCYRRAARRARSESLDRVYAVFPILRERHRQLAGSLSGGQQQMLAIGRALMARPRLLLVDEPSLGLAPAVVDQVFEVVQAIHRDGVSILLIEQNAAKALEIAGRAYVLEGGRVVSEGRPGELLTQSHIREAYLGGGA